MTDFASPALNDAVGAALNLAAAGRWGAVEILLPVVDAHGDLNDVSRSAALWLRYSLKQPVDERVTCRACYLNGSRFACDACAERRSQELFSSEDRMRRLQLYGDTESNLRRRSRLSSSRFGTWLADVYDDVGELRGWDDPQMSARDLHDLVCELLDAVDDVSGDWPIGDYTDFVGWIHERFAEAGEDDLLSSLETLESVFCLWSGSSSHACGSVIPEPIDWPDAGGVYFVLVRDLQRVKIGKASSVKRRLVRLQTACPGKLELVAVAQGGLKEEAAYHQRFAEHRLVGEWFSGHPAIWAVVRALRGLHV